MHPILILSTTRPDKHDHIVLVPRKKYTLRYSIAYTGHDFKIIRNARPCITDHPENLLHKVTAPCSSINKFKPVEPGKIGRLSKGSTKKNYFSSGLASKAFKPETDFDKTKILHNFWAKIYKYIFFLKLFFP